MRRVARALGAAVTVCAMTAVARAQPSPALPTRVRIEPPTCAVGPFDVAAWQGLARSEIETDGVDAVEVGPAPTGDDALAVIRVEVSPCAVDATEVAVSIDDLLTRKTVRRVVALDDIPAPARARALALAVAELLRASWAELALPEAHVDPATVPPAVRRAVLLRLRPAVLAATPVEPVAPAVPPPPVRPWWAAVTLDVRTFPGQSGALLGGRGIISWRPWRALPLRVRADVGGAQGTAFARRGEVDMTTLTGAVAVQVGGGNELLDLAVGPRLEAGWAWVTGHAATAGVVGSSDSDATVTALLAATLRVTLGGRWSAVIDVSAGQTLRYVTVSAEGDQVTGLRGPTFSVGLGLGGSW